MCNGLLLAAVLVLPGCLAINAAFGVLGLLGTGPVQYAGVAYTMGEYTYEYTVNDKTPDMVIGEKFAFLTPELDTGPANPIPAVDVASVSKTAKPTLELSPTVEPAIPEPEIMVAAATPTPEVQPVVQNTVAPKPIRVKRQRRLETRPAPAAPAVAVVAPVQREYEYISRETDPLLVKLHRLGQAFRQAEKVVMANVEDGLRLTVPPAEAANSNGGISGISGSWSIRHGLMEHSPSVSPDSMIGAGSLDDIAPVHIAEADQIS